MIDAGDFDETPLGHDAIIRSHPAHDLSPKSTHVGMPSMATMPRSKVA
jgi:hypothetical protein